MSSVRIRDFPCPEGVCASLAFYPAGATQHSHFHGYAQLSLLLSGQMLERHGKREWTPLGAALGIKPPGLRHENGWGREGTLIFSLKLESPAWQGKLPPIEPGWRLPVSPQLGPELVRACVAASDSGRREEALADFLSLPLIRPEAPHRAPPPWLAAAREAIRDEPDVIRIDEAAALAGIHRVRFSALFNTHFGLPPSLYRLKVMTARAVAGIIDSRAPLTAVAHDMGFSDQAHLTRSTARFTGLAPKSLRALLA